jgi:hypothetical protein
VLTEWHSGRIQLRKSYVPFNQTGETGDPIHETWTANGCTFRYCLPLHLPPVGTNGSLRLRGILHLWVATKWEKVEADYPQSCDATPSVAHLSDGHSITIMNVSSAIDPAINLKWPAVRFDLSRDKLSPEQWLSYRHLLGAAVTMGRVSVRDRQARELEQSSHYIGNDSNGQESSTTSDDGNHATIYASYECPNSVGPATKVIINFPIERTELTIPYDIKNIPLAITN